MCHGQKKNWERQPSADPESTRHVSQFGILFLARASWHVRFECHAADWTIIRMILLNLRMHRTGVNNHLCLVGRWLAFERHAAFCATSRSIAFNALAHWTKILSRRALTGSLPRCLWLRWVLRVTTRMVRYGFLRFCWFVHPFFQRASSNLCHLVTRPMNSAYFPIASTLC